MSTTLEAIKQQTEELHQMRLHKKEIENQLAVQNAAITSLELSIMNELESAGLETFKGPSCTVTVCEEQKICTPKSPEDKKALVSYFKETGRDPWDYLSVNYQTLNSFYKNELKIRPEVILPGCEMGALRKKLSVRSK